MEYIEHKLSNVKLTAWLTKKLKENKLMTYSFWY